MKAVVTLAHGGRDQLKFVDDYPDPRPASNEVLVKVAATALNYHDIFTRKGMPGIRVPLPLIVGSDISGEIAALGSDVRGWNPGDRVLLNPFCAGPQRQGLIGEACDGGRAEYVAVAATQLLRLPPAVGMEAAAALPLAYGTAYRMLVTRGRIQAGEKVLILGASGGVGVACVQLAKLLGAEVFACASAANKLARLRELGADQLINYTQDKITDAVYERIGKPRVSGTGGVDVAINFTGGDTFIDTQKCLTMRGRLLVCGATTGFHTAMDARYLWTFEHEIIGSNGWAPEDLTTLLELVASGRLSPAIDTILPLARASEAERMLEAREVVGKVLLRP